MQDAADSDPQDASLSTSKKSEPMVSAIEMLVILFGSPISWLVQMWLSEPLAAHACFPRERTLDQPVFAHLSLTILLIGLIALSAALASTGLAWRTRQRLMSPSDKPHARRFLVEIGLLAASACSIAVLFTLAAVLLVSPCAPW